MKTLPMVATILIISPLWNQFVLDLKFQRFIDFPPSYLVQHYSLSYVFSVLM